MSQKSGKTSPVPEDDAHLLAPPARSTRSSTSSQPDVGAQTRSAGLPTNLKLKYITQSNRVHLIKEILAKLSGDSTWNPQDLAQTHDQLQELHKNFSKTHSYFESAWPESCLDHEYFASSLFLEEYSLYQAASSKLVKLTTSMTSKPSTSSQVPQPSQNRPRLPDISIPTFSGDFSKWPAFRDLFRSLVIKNTLITDIERLHYLRTCLSSDPLDTISSLPLTEDSFSIAWRKLMEKYENKRLLLSSQYSKLLSFSLANQKNSTASSLRQLLDSIVNPLQSLKALGDDLEQNNNLLVFHIINRMDHSSRTHWENLISSNTQFPTFAQLKEFLQSRSRALEWIEANQKQPSQETSRSRTTVHTTCHKATSPAQPPPSLASNKSATSNTPVSIKSNSMPSYNCDDCGCYHFIADCPRFANRSPQEKADVVLHRVLCTNCLGRHHRRFCKTTKACKFCGSHHHSLLHDVPLSSKPFSKIPPVPPRVLPTSALTSSKSTQKEPLQLNTLLATAIANLFTSTASHTVRLLIDSGSELTFISQDLATRLNISRRKSHVVVVGINGRTSKTQGSLSLTLKSTYDHQAINIEAHILSSSFSNLPSFYTSFQHSPHLQNLKLADPEYHVSRAIDIILGADVYGSVVLPQMKKGPPSSPIAQLSIFGWLILGPVCQDQERLPIQSPMFHTVTDEDLHHLLIKFWEQEEIQPTSSSPLTPDEQACENHFVATHSRLASGKYMVRLPLKSPIDVLGSSRQRAFRCLQALIRKFNKDPDYSLLYHQFLDEYEQLQHMQPVSSERVTSRYFLPHHGVLKTDSTTTKLRVVFNGSSPTSTGISLNDIMHTGAKLQLDVIDVLLWVRKFKFVFSTDITKMYRQILVHPDDWDLQSILWLDSNNQVKAYHLTTVTYGTRPAPFLAIRVLLQLLQDEGHKFPLAISPLTKGRYVDDICGGADTQEQLFEIAKQLLNLCMAAGLPLAKWQSNVSNLSHIVQEEESPSTPISFDENPTSTKVLGLLWYPQEDYFTFKVSSNLSGSLITKRSVLSQIAKIFDPLGLVSPVTIRAKMLLQELWLQKLSWDEPLPQPLQQKWHDISEDLSKLASITIPRWINTQDSSYVHLHGFSDASQFAISAVLYLLVRTPSKECKVSMLCSKTKVTPLKPLTIPRLELSAALLLSRLVNYAHNVLDLNISSTILWTDSSITLAWIKTHPSRWKDFVRNRVATIQDLTPRAHWRYISGKENPADCASRGLTSSQLRNHSLWWTGPSWLSKSEDSWPNRQPAPTTDHESESRPSISILTTTTSDYAWDLIYRYSSLNKLLRITSICSKVLARFQRKLDPAHLTNLTSTDLEASRIFWIKATQEVYFLHELKALRSQTPFPSSSVFSRLTAFLDNNGIIRVGGRISHSLLDPDSKHPIILPRHSQFTSLVIDDAHRKTLHGGTQLTLATIRQRYWIIGGRAPVKSHILKCVLCARHRGIRAQQLMGQLPESRVQPSRPFLHTGVDYAGPLTIKTWKGRGAKTHKGWVCVFVCFASSAVHLEVVSDYSTDSFLAAFRRFTSRRGICHTLYSDCGTTFIGADTALKELFTKASSQNQTLSNQLLNEGTTWCFNPPAAPHMGGKYEAVVKSFKHHFKRTVKDASFTLEEIMTLTSQIEAILNSRPLEPLSDDPDDCAALTPGHLLIGTPLTALPEPSLEHLNTSRLSRWQFVQQRTQQFWTQWSSQYLQRQLSISKWHHPRHDIKIGSLVLITDERTPPCKWPLARVIDLHPGHDGLTRVVTLRTATTTLRRPIAKLSILPILVDQEDNERPVRSSDGWIE